MLVRFSIDDVKYTYDTDTLLVAEARYIKKQFGLTAGEFLQGIAQLDGDALASMVFVSKRRAGEHVVPGDLDSLDLMPLITSIGEAANAEDEADEPEPTPPAPAAAAPVEAPLAAVPDAA